MIEVETEFFRFAVTYRVIEKLNFLEGRGDHNRQYLIHQIISAGDLVRRVRKNGLELTSATTPLIFPPLTRRTIHRAHTFEAWLHPGAAEAFRELTAEAGHDPYSALSWSLTCYQIIDEARVLNAVFYEGPSAAISWRPLWA